MEARERAAVWVRTLRLVFIAVPRRELKLLSFIGLTNGGARGAGRVHGDGIMQRAKRVVAPFEDYFVIIKRCVDHRKTPQTRWTWGIQRRSKPLGVKFDVMNMQQRKMPSLLGKRR